MVAIVSLSVMALYQTQKLEDEAMNMYDQVKNTVKITGLMNSLYDEDQMTCQSVVAKRFV